MSEMEMSKWESAVEQAIREAQARGEFDNLPNQGKPLDLTPNPYAGDRELRAGVEGVFDGDGDLGIGRRQRDPAQREPRVFNLKVPLVDKQRSPLVAEEMLASLGIRDDEPPAEGSTAAEPAPAGQETERSRLQEALYRLIQGREKMPLSPGWHNARRKAIFRYVDRLREMRKKQ